MTTHTYGVTCTCGAELEADHCDTCGVKDAHGSVVADVADVARKWPWHECEEVGA